MSQKPPLAKEAGSGKAPSASSHIRIARPSQDIAKAERFYVEGLGLSVLWRCGPDATGGHPLDDSHAETPPKPTEEDLLVIYVDDSVDPAVVERLVAAGGTRVTARNEYWEEFGVTVADPDGYRLVLSQKGWANEAL
ncbi:glyoxalase family protein [Arthroderma uncinatum]|uniref:glyoxalase family protein n=1 Tax=Arthroderma uncinatum TaxID=74035 RepID=UPI00144A862B|nr:glyoxalase family protein [Arthroderma uncinatum]KAF3482973.1 glyoxalase family protein [Arthroderma uncinatum]